jgi:hypothetical protein
LLDSELFSPEWSSEMEPPASSTKIESAKVKKIVFSGIDITGFDGHDIIVTNRTILRILIDALNSLNKDVRDIVNAEAVNRVKIHFHDDTPSVNLSFRPQNDFDCFGKRFRSALSFVSDLESKRLTKFIEKVGGSVISVSIQVNDVPAVVVENKPHVVSIMNDLKNITGAAFSFTSIEIIDIVINLQTKRNGVLDLFLTIPASRSVAPQGRRWPPLPPTLWHYVNTKQHRKTIR